MCTGGIDVDVDGSSRQEEKRNPTGNIHRCSEEDLQRVGATEEDAGTIFFPFHLTHPKNHYMMNKSVT